MDLFKERFSFFGIWIRALLVVSKTYIYICDHRGKPHYKVRAYDRKRKPSSYRGAIFSRHLQPVRRISHEISRCLPFISISLGSFTNKTEFSCRESPFRKGKLGSFHVVVTKKKKLIDFSRSTTSYLLFVTHSCANAAVVGLWSSDPRLRFSVGNRLYSSVFRRPGAGRWQTTVCVCVCMWLAKHKTRA